MSDAIQRLMAERDAARAEVERLRAALESCLEYITGWGECAPWDPPDPRSTRDREAHAVVAEARAALAYGKEARQ